MKGTAGTPLIDCDSHCAEPPELWESEYMDATYRGASHFRIVDTFDPRRRPRAVLWEGGFQIMEDAAYSGHRRVALRAPRAGREIPRSEPQCVGRESSAGRPRPRGDRLSAHQSIGGRSAARSREGPRTRCCDEPPRTTTGSPTPVRTATTGCSQTCSCPWQDLDLAREDVERCAERESLRLMICPSPWYPSGWIGDRAFDTVYSVIEERGLLLNVNSSDPFAS